MSMDNNTAIVIVAAVIAITVIIRDIWGHHE